MCLNNNLKRGIFITISVIGVTLILSALQYLIYYYNNPIEKEVDFTTTGCIIWNPKGTEWENVDVEVRGKSLHYILKNRRKAMQGNILINGYSILGNFDNRDEYIGFYTEFYGEGFGCVETSGDHVPCEIIALSEDLQFIVCGVHISLSAFDRGETERNGQALLVIPGNDIESAKKIIKNASLNSKQMSDWLLENGWDKLIETNQ